MDGRTEWIKGIIFIRVWIKNNLIFFAQTPISSKYLLKICTALLTSLQLMSTR